MSPLSRPVAISMSALLLVVNAGGSVIAASPAASDAAAPSGGPGIPRSNVSELITFIPPTAQSVGFTDWGRIRASQGAQDVTGASPVEDKLRLAMSTSRDEAAASGFGIAHLRDHHDVWGWDALDLDWEATIQGDGPPLFVLRFRDGFDLAPVIARFDDRGFSSDVRDGATIRSHEMTISEDWLRATEFAILNTAFLDDGRTLVLSGGLDQVQDVVANHGRYPASPVLAATAATLDGASALFLAPGLGTCLGFTPLPFDPGDPLASPLASLAPSSLHPYAILGVGYGRPDWDPVGRISFGYLDTATAEADLAARAQLARDGVSVRAGVPYADAVFQVEDARVDGTNLELDVSPAGGLPRRLFDMVYARDMTFAGC